MCPVLGLKIIQRFRCGSIFYQLLYSITCPWFIIFLRDDYLPLVFYSCVVRSLFEHDFEFWLLQQTFDYVLFLSDNLDFVPISTRYLNVSNAFASENNSIKQLLNLKSNENTTCNLMICPRKCLNLWDKIRDRIKAWSLI